MSSVKATRWTNWAGNQQAWPKRIFAPRSSADLVQIVQEAKAEGRRIRVCGEGHTFSALVPTDDFLVDIRALRRLAVDPHHPDGPRVRVDSGASVAEVDAALQSVGLVIPTNVVLSSVRRILDLADDVKQTAIGVS